MSFKKVLSQIRSDLKNHGGKNFRSSLKTYFFNPSFRLLLNYRLGKYFYEHKSSFFHILALRYRYVQITKRGCEISFRCKIGNNVKFSHPIGIVIGDEVVIEDNIRIWQHVTLGSHGKSDRSISYPIVCSGTKIFAGAIVIGNVKIGCNCIIGANSFVNIDVPNNSIAVGAPAKILVK